MPCDFLIIDTYNMIARSKMSWTKDPSRNLVVLSFLRSLRKALDEFKATKVIMPLDDHVGNSFRRELFPGYKAGRKAQNERDDFNEHFKRQKALILLMLKNVMPVFTLKYKGYEADDIIAAICKTVSDDVNVVVWSNDKDLIQLQQKFENVMVWDPQEKCFFSAPPYDIVTYKALVGDKSDGIPGVGGIGKKRVLRVLGSHEKFIEAVGSKPDKFATFRLNKRLIDLVDCDLPVPEDVPEKLRGDVAFDVDKFDMFMRELGLSSEIGDGCVFRSVFLEAAMRHNRSKRNGWFFNKAEEWS